MKQSVSWLPLLRAVVNEAMKQMVRSKRSHETDWLLEKLLLDQNAFS